MRSSKHVYIVLCAAANWQSCEATHDHATRGLPLVQPRQVRLADYTISGFDLELDVVPFSTSGGTFDTRAFDGDIPGPTLIMQRGATNKVNLVNRLTGPDQAYVHNEYGHVSSTNIHTHGLHVPHVTPGDDVKITIGPETTFNYQWDVPADHAPGTHWYHPHLHGSTALQTGGGAHGMIVLEDEASDGEPSWLLDLVEMQLIVHVVPQTGATSLDAIETAAGGSVVTSSTSADLVLVNGQNAPVVSMATGQWYRWRVLFVSINHHATLTTTGSGCEFGVLAKDGIYVEDAPRASSYIKLASGNRVDILIRCTADSTLASRSDAGGARRRMQNGNGAGAGAATELSDTTLATIEVTGTDTSTGSLASLAFTPTRPTYLSDLRTVAVHGSKEIQIQGGGGCSINDEVWAGDGSDHLFTVYESTYEEYTVEAANHPMHIHVNPVQVQSDDDPWNAPGDWMDVVMSNGVYRQHLADHAGTVIVHCHWLSHEDLGCMSQFTIEACATDDPANGVLGTCSTHETLGLPTMAIVMIIILALLAAVAACFALRYWYRQKGKLDTETKGQPGA